MNNKCLYVSHSTIVDLNLFLAIPVYLIPVLSSSPTSSSSTSTSVKAENKHFKFSKCTIHAIKLKQK